jgi:Cu(I)/Ag(I) efflux system membrane fusion protein
MKKYISYIGILAAGLFLGWILFGSSSNKKTEQFHAPIVIKNQKWTCSMHSQILKPEPGDCPICKMDLISVNHTRVGLLADQFKLSQNAMALANIQTSIVGTSKSNENTIKLSGKIVENKNTTATMPAHFNGRIEKLYIKSLGQHVEKGQVIAQVYSPKLIAAQQELIITYKSKNSKPKLYNSVRNKFKNWMINDAQLDAIQKTGEVKRQFTLYSHVSGVVTEILINEGSYMIDGKPLFRVSNLNTVWANFDVYENKIHLFKKGQEISIVTNAFPNKEFKAKVDFIDPILNVTTRTVKLRVILNNKEFFLKPGMFVEGKLNVLRTNKEQVLNIPSSAVLWTGKRSVVYIKPNSSQSVFAMREITLGAKIGDDYNVLEGLNIGDEIVSNGTFTVDAAAQLQGEKSMMHRRGGRLITDYEVDQGMITTPTKTNEESKENEQLEVPNEFQAQLKSVINLYMKIKNALVIEDAVFVKKQSVILFEALSKVDIKSLNNAIANNRWMSLENALKMSVSSIANTNDIEEQRTHFRNLSTSLSKVLISFKINEKVYYQFCPMTDNYKGGYWLSKEEKIINPYFGEAMLTCGEIKQVIE